VAALLARTSKDNRSYFVMMLIEKICRGVLAVETEAGVRYIQPSLVERIWLTWTFRNFHVLPEEVLNRRERALIDSLCRNGKFLVNGNGRGDLSLHSIGTVERSARRPQPQSTRLKPAARMQRAPGTLPRAS
jgi:hypothetical protein